MENKNAQEIGSAYCGFDIEQCKIAMPETAQLNAFDWYVADAILTLVEYGYDTIRIDDIYKTDFFCDWERTAPMQLAIYRSINHILDTHLCDYMSAKYNTKIKIIYIAPQQLEQYISQYGIWEFVQDEQDRQDKLETESNITDLEQWYNKHEDFYSGDGVIQGIRITDKKVLWEMKVNDVKEEE